MKRAVSTDQAPSAPHLLSQVIISNGLIFVAGQVHVLPDNTLVGETTEEKTHQVMKNIKTILEAADASMDDIVKVTIYVTNIAMMPDLNEAYPTYFTEPFPVREAVCVKALPLGASIEISVVAVKSD